MVMYNRIYDMYAIAVVFSLKKEKSTERMYFRTVSSYIVVNSPLRRPEGPFGYLPIFGIYLPIRQRRAPPTPAGVVPKNRVVSVHL